MINKKVYFLLFLRATRTRSGGDDPDQEKRRPRWDLQTFKTVAISMMWNCEIIKPHLLQNDVIFATKTVYRHFHNTRGEPTTAVSGLSVNSLFIGREAKWKFPNNQYWVYAIVFLWILNLCRINQQIEKLESNVVVHEVCQCWEPRTLPLYLWRTRLQVFSNSNTMIVVMMMTMMMML